MQKNIDIKIFKHYIIYMYIFFFNQLYDLLIIYKKRKIKKREKTKMRNEKRKYKIENYMVYLYSYIFMHNNIYI